VKALEPLLNAKSAVAPQRRARNLRTADGHGQNQRRSRNPQDRPEKRGMPVAFAIFTASVGTVVTKATTERRPS
jgi:hypothetical protein